MSQPRCESPSDSCPRARRWSARLGRFLWVCECGKAFPENSDGAPSDAPLRGDPDPAAPGCPTCGALMVRVSGSRYRDFYSCSRFKEGCKGTRPITPAPTDEGETP